jgi:sulfate adenylyltransferase
MAEERTAHGDLVPVHGGGSELVDRVVPLNQRRRLLAEAEKLASIVVSRADLATVYRIADGTLSPLEGPMDAETWHRVLDEECLRVDGHAYAWTIPLSLPITDEEAKALTPGGRVALRTERDEVVGILAGLDLFEWDKIKYLKAVYGTDRVDHPGGHSVDSDSRRRLVGGSLRALPQPPPPEYGRYMLSPRMVRALIRERRWERALALQTRNPLHRAHEYALVAGAERLTREGYFTGVVLNPLVGELKGDDVPAVVRMRCYQVLKEDRLLGQGDKDESLWESVGYDLADVFELIGLDIKMFYGGPKEAVMHAIYRQNEGFTHLVVGRRHADAPFDDGTPIWGDFDAQEIFEHLRGSLALRPCKIGFAAFYPSLGRVDLSDDHPDQEPLVVSGTQVRRQLMRGERPDPHILRPEIAAILIEAYQHGLSP